MEGALPYQDYSSEFGPLMPYYYGSFFKAFGVTIPSLMVGKIFLIMISGVFIYLSLNLYAKPLISFLAAAWYFLTYKDFFFTFNQNFLNLCLSVIAGKIGEVDGSCGR